MRRHFLKTMILCCYAMALCAVAVRAELPPLIPREVLFGAAEKDLPRISPDGKWIAYLAPSEKDVPNIWVQKLGSSGIDKMITHDTHRGISHYYWAYDSRHLLYLQDKDGDENWHVYSIDIDTQTSRDLTPFQGIQAQNILLSPFAPNEMLVGLNLRDSKVFDMYRINILTGAAVLEVKNPGNVIGWTVDHRFQIRAATLFDPNTGSTILQIRESSHAPWYNLIAWPFEDETMYGQVNGSSVVTNFSLDGRFMNIISSMTTDTTRLIQVSARSGRVIKVVAANSESDIAFDPTADNLLQPQVMINPRNEEVQAVGFDSLMPEWKVVDPKIRTDFDFLKQTHAGSFFITSRGQLDKKWVVGYLVDDGPISYYLYDRVTKKIQFLFANKPQLLEYHLAKTTPFEFRSSDGLMLTGYMTLPVGVEPRNLPLVLLVHGGPWWRDTWGFDPIVQLLANRGYAVLQVNFRGSIGFGKKLLNAGNHEWGRGKMMQDRNDAVNWVVRQGIADPHKVAIMGASYGGYATLSGLTFSAASYVCGVDIVGPSDVKSLFESFPNYWKPVKKRWTLRVGDVEKDEALNQAISPLYHVDAIQVPLLIGHGANDPRVKMKDSETLVEAMRKKNLPVTFVVYPDEGHGFARAENNRDFFGRTEEFLQQHLGGRAEPWSSVPGSTAELR